MQSKSIGLGTASNVLSALEEIGFTIDSVENTARWGNDTNNKIYFKIGNNTQLNLYNSSDTLIHNSVSFNSSSTYKIIYENIGDSIVFGFNYSTAAGNSILFAVIEPTTSEDDWLYVCPYYSSYNEGVTKFVNGRIENYISVPLSQLYNGSALGVQIVKAYDGTRYCNNLYLTSVSQNIAIHNTNTSTDNNFLEATIGNDTYLIFNVSNAITGTKFAIKKTAVS